MFCVSATRLAFTWRLSSDAACASMPNDPIAMSAVAAVRLANRLCVGQPPRKRRVISNLRSLDSSLAPSSLRPTGDATRQAASAQSVAGRRNSAPLCQLIQFGDDRCNRRAGLLNLFLEVRLDGGVAVPEQDDRPPYSHTRVARV